MPRETSFFNPNPSLATQSVNQYATPVVSTKFSGTAYQQEYLQKKQSGQLTAEDFDPTAALPDIAKEVRRYISNNNMAYAYLALVELVSRDPNALKTQFDKGDQVLSLVLQKLGLSEKIFYDTVAANKGQPNKKT